MNAAKEHFSISFVRMVTYAAGMSIKNHETDYDGVDITIASSTEYSIWDCPEFELQVKCTSQQDLLHEKYMSWTLEAGPFEKLTSPKRYNAAYLAVLLLPNDAGPWLEQDENMLLTRSRMYWQSAANLGQLKEDSASKTVRLPRSNLFDVTAVQDIMRTIGEGSDR
jgi:hypothetical protein